MPVESAHSSVTPGSPCCRCYRLLLPLLTGFSDGGKDATHGLGIAFGAFALGNSAGDIVGGSLAEHHRGVACLVSGALASAALLSLAVFGWKETAPSLEKGQRWWWWRRCLCCCCAEKSEEERGTGGGGGASSGISRESTRSHDAENGSSDASASRRDDHLAGEDGGERGRGSARKGGRTKLLSPLLVLRVFLESRYTRRYRPLAFRQCGRPLICLCLGPAALSVL